MKWLKSTTSKAWTVEGKLVPAVDSGKYLQLEDQDFNNIAKRPVIASLIRAGGILVCNEEPAELKNTIEGMTKANIDLAEENKKLVKRAAELEERIAELEKAAPVDIEAIKAQAQEEIKAEAVKELQEMQDQLKAKDAEIEALTKKLEKAKKKNSGDAE